MRDLKKKRPIQEIEEGELLPQKGTKQQKIAKDPKDKRSSSVDRREEQNLAKVHLPQRVWSPRLEVDGAAIPWNAFVREYQRGHSAHVAESLEQPLLLPKDMDALRKLKQHYLFLSLKKDLALITQEVYVAEEWVNRARNDARNEANLRLDAEKALGAANEENKDLATKLTASERDRNLAGLKIVETQVEDQHKLLYQTKIELATSRQLALDLKVELQKAREVAQLAKEALEAEKQAA